MSDGYGRSAPFSISRDQSIRLIVQTCIENDVTDEHQIAYILATAEHESANFRKPEEDYGRDQAAVRGYWGGDDYFGRGYVHLTHRYNYVSMGEKLGLGNELAEHPEKATEPTIAARALVIGVRDGYYSGTGKTLNSFINEHKVDYDGARSLVNGTDAKEQVSALARAWESKIPDLVESVKRDGVDMTPLPSAARGDFPLQTGISNARAFELQQYLAELGSVDEHGKPLAADGDFGPGTSKAVREYKEGRGISDNGIVDEALFNRIKADALTVNPDFELKSMTELYGALNDKVLSTGDKGQFVEEFQKQLAGLGATGLDGKRLKTDGDFGPSTIAAVTRFQRENGIEPANGIADEATRDAVNAKAVQAGLAETSEVVSRREALQEQASFRPTPLRTDAGGFDSPFLNHYFAAAMSGNQEAADRALRESSAGQQFSAETAEATKALDQQQAQQQEAARQAPALGG